MEEMTNRSEMQGHPQTQSEKSLGDTERWASLISGGALVLSGLQQRSLRGALLALAGGSLVYHGVAGQKGVQEVVGEAAGMNQSLKVEKTVTIQTMSPEDLYGFWRNFENLPVFMKHLKSVQVIDERRSHWVANAPLGASVEWDAEIVNEQPNRLIAWASVEGADVENSGFVRFQPATGGRGTEVKVVLEYSPPGGALGATFAKLFGESPEQQLADDLYRFKQVMEAGEIASTEGQPSGRQMSQSAS